MNDIQRGVLTLLKSGISGEKLALPEGFSMEEAEPVIARHHITLLAYQGAVNCGVPADSAAMQRMFQQYCRGLMHSERQMKMVGRIFRTFDENGVDYLPLKGCKMKALYPKPELRTMGDADILIRMEQYDLIRPLMKELGMEEKYESDHELVWDSKDLHLELHKQLIPSKHGEYHTYFEDSWRMAKPVSGTRYAFSVEDEFIYLFIHFTKHYRRGGIGLRHMMDLWVYCRAHRDMDEDYIAAELEKLHLRQFRRSIFCTLGAWFASEPLDERSDFITQFIFECGSWGSLENLTFTRHVQNASLTGSAKKGRLVSICQRLFPRFSAMRGMYPILKKAPYLLPVLWFVRLVRALLFDRGKIRRTVREERLATPEKIESYRWSLNYVGLDFWSE